MKLYPALLSKFIDIPSHQTELRDLLDDLGLEVKAEQEDGAEPVYTVETLANRGDHLYALGVAREISARTLSKIKLPVVLSELPTKTTSVPIKKETDKCSRYALLQATLPAGFKLPTEVENTIGRSDHPAIVDVLNFVQLELGQPMHAFDEEKIEGEIRIELSSKEERIIALDGKEYRVPPGSIMIRDRKKIVAIGGVIGCANSMVTETTRKVLIESAAFDPIAVRLTARGMGISTDASYAFERGSDREAVVFALKRVAHLLKGSQGSVSEDASHLTAYSLVAGPNTETRKISLDPKTVRREMNLAKLSEIEIKSRLQQLGYVVVEQEDKKFLVSVPSWRLWDVENEPDLVEDFARSHGLNNIKLELPPLDYSQDTDTLREKLWERLEPTLLGAGFYEVITEPFYSAEEIALLSKVSPEIESKHVTIANAREGNCSHLKITNILHLANLATFNERRGVQSVKVFEKGRLFGMGSGHAPDDGFKHEREVLSLALSGRWFENEFRKVPSAEENLFAVKGVLEALFLGLGREMVCEPGNNPLLHPGQQARVVFQKEEIGFFGTIHPEFKSSLDLQNPFVYAELDVVLLEKLHSEKQYQAFGEFPAIRRDITVRLPKKDFATKYSQVIERAKLENFRAIQVVDDFEKAEEGFRRVSYRLTFQNSERTLEHAEVDGAIADALKLLKEKHQIELA